MVQSIAAVPCGVTDYRQNLFKQTPYDAETSAAVIDIMEEFGDECKRRHGKRIIYPSDEWYACWPASAHGAAGSWCAPKC